MNESNQNIPVPSQESFSETASCSVNEVNVTSAVSEGEKSESVKPAASKIAKPTGLKLSTANVSNPVARIGRLCNNIPKPGIPPNPVPSTDVQILTCIEDGQSDLAGSNGPWAASLLSYLHREHSVNINETGAGGGGGGGGEGTMSTFSTRRISDELARKRLTDVDETDENTVPYYGNGKWDFERKMSNASTSVDSFSDHWKSDLDRRRASDASVVLTENTDQFIIGDRVWVGGVKPGQIAYIGETQFAPGEWAGIVLDEPIGKNDGTVANIRYFQCEPKKGIFSRLTRLTRYPLVEGGAGEPAASRPASTENRRSNGSLLTSVPKKSSLVLTPSAGPKTPVPKSPSPDSSLHPSVQIGDRVIIKSSQGSKAGILRYLGTTDFAPGEWCGVELDDPLGKNDGSVSGTRYFECRPKFGLFAPLHKVSKSPANKRFSQGNCVIHNRSGVSTSGIRRQGSKESLMSLSSTASTAASVRSTNKKIGVRTPTTPTSAKMALQETLKEKELHIEQLLKERDLERAEVTRAASQADEAERRLVALKQEFEQQKEEAEARTSDLDAMVCLLKSENTELKNLLDEERKKYEDLQFQFEEETIDKADLKATILKCQEKINILEKALSEEKKRVEALEQDSNKLFEAEEQMVIVKDDLDSAKEEIVELKKIQSNLEQEQISLEAHLTSARAEIESLKIENGLLKSSASQDQNNLRENLAKTIQAFEECKQELEKKQKDAARMSEELKAKDQSSSEKENELHSKYLKIINELTEKHKSEIGNLSKQMENLKNSSETKLKILENQLEEKIKFASNLEAELNKVNILLLKTSEEKSLEQSKQKEAEEKLKQKLNEIEDVVLKKNEQLAEETSKREAILREKQKIEEELAEIRKMLTNANKSADQQVVTLNEVIEKQKEDLEKYKTQIELKAKEYGFLEENLAKSKSEAERQLQEKDTIIKGKDLEIEKLEGEMMKQKEKLDLKNEELKQFYESREESFKIKVKNLEDQDTERLKQIEILNKDLENVKNLLSEGESRLRNEEIKNKNLSEKLTVLEENYKMVLHEKEQIQLETEDTVRKLRSLEEKLAQMAKQKAKLESDISNFANSCNDSSSQLAKLNDDLRSKEKEMDALREDIFQKTQKFEREEQALKKAVEKQEAELKISKEELEKVKRDHSVEVKSLEEKLAASNASLKAADVEWRKMMENLKSDSDSQINNLKEQIMLMEKKEIENNVRHEEDVKKLKSYQEDLKGKLSEVEANALTCKNSLERKIEELMLERNNLLDSVEKTKVEFLNNEKQITEKVKKDAEFLANESEKLRNELKETNEKLATTVEELLEAKNEKNKLNEEKSKLERMTSTLEKLVEELQEKNKEMEVNATSVESENKALKDAINQLREEKCVLDKDSTDKMMQLVELRSQLEALDYSRKTRETENEVKIRNLEAETSELRSKLQKTEMSHSVQISEKNKQVDDLKMEIDKLKQESNQIMSGKDKNIESINAEMNELRSELSDRKFELERKTEQVEKMEKKFQEIKEELDLEKKKCEEYGKRLNVSETERIDLKERFEEQSKLLVGKSDLEGRLAETMQKLTEAERREQETANNAKLEKETLEKMLETTSGLLNQRENETKVLAKEIEVLREEKLNLTNSRTTLVEALEKEKADLQKRLEDATKTVGIQNNTNTDASQRELQEEREFQKGQVDFLNSVIVDMQKKNDALKARIEILEMGFSPEDVDEFNLHNIAIRSVAPRLFCDICDRFDLHDTEDCQKQASDDVPPSKSSKVKVPPPERPYCEICEAFGHDTADCDDGETF